MGTSSDKIEIWAAFLEDGGFLFFKIQETLQPGLPKYFIERHYEQDLKFWVQALGAEWRAAVEYIITGDTERILAVEAFSESYGWEKYYQQAEKYRQAEEP